MNRQNRAATIAQDGRLQADGAASLLLAEDKVKISGGSRPPIGSLELRQLAASCNPAGLFSDVMEVDYK